MYKRSNNGANMSIEKLFVLNRNFCLYLDNKDSSLHAIESCADDQQTFRIWQISFYKHTHTHPDTIMMLNLYYDKTEKTALWGLS
jgi:hypothetical protein